MGEFNLIQIQELKKDIEVLQARYQAIKEQIRDGIDPDQEVKLQNRLQKIIAEINSKENEIRQLETKNKITPIIANNQNQNYTKVPRDFTILKNQLMTLNYIEQTDSFRDFWNSENNPPIGAFLIQGKIKGCHQWLINQLLIKNFPDFSDTSEKLSITIERETSIEDLWRKLALTLSESSSTTPQNLIEKVYKIYQQRTVVLVFYHLERLDKTEPKKLIEEFWNPLVELLQQHPNEHYFNLAMFLVNHTSQSNEWDIDCAETVKTEPVYKPIRLKPIENFRKILIRNWIMQNRNNFSQLLPKVNKIDLIIQDIWEESSEGEPKDVIEGLCNRCGTAFYPILQSLSI